MKQALSAARPNPSVMERVVRPLTWTKACINTHVQDMSHHVYIELRGNARYSVFVHQLLISNAGYLNQVEPARTYALHTISMYLTTVEHDTIRYRPQSKEGQFVCQNNGELYKVCRLTMSRLLNRLLLTDWMRKTYRKYAKITSRDRARIFGDRNKKIGADGRQPI